VQGLRDAIPDFDMLLTERKQAFQISDKLTEAISSNTTAPLLPSTPTRQKASSLTRPSAFGSLSQRIFSPKTTPRALSPRGRQSLSVETPTKGRTATPSPSKLPGQFSTIEDIVYNATSGTPHFASASPNKLDMAELIQGFSEPRKRELNRQVQIPSLASEDTGGGPCMVDIAESDSSESEDSDSATSSESDGAADDDEVQAPHNQNLRQETGHQSRQQANTVSVSHVLTNVVVLQHFLVEMAALIQVRAATMDDVKFG